jgi:hypothetical protein
MVMSVKLNNASANETKTGSRPRKSRRNHVVDRELFRRERLYGEVVVDFANARSPEEAFEILTKHMQKLADEKLIITRLKKGNIVRTFERQKRDIRILLTALKSHKNLREIDKIHEHIFCYNSCCKPFVDIQDDGSIEDISDFNEHKHIAYDVFLSYCLINFLKHESSLKRRYVYSCTWRKCDRFFIAKKMDSRNRVCSKCRHLNRMPPEWRQQTDADRRYEIIEKRIAKDLQDKYEYLRGSGYSEKEADKEARECIWEEVERNTRLDRHKPALEEFIKWRHRF